MEYRKFGDTYIVRMDPGEEILTQLKVFAEQEGVKLASVTALGRREGLHRGSVRHRRQGLQVQPLPGSL